MKSKIALAKNFMAGVGGQISNVLFRLIQVPIFLSALSLDEYGQWLMLYTIPSVLLLSNPGFAAVAATKLNIEFAAGQEEDAKKTYTTGFFLIIILSVVLGVLAYVASILIPWSTFLQASSKQALDIQNAAFLLACAVLVSLPTDLFVGAFKAARKMHWAMHLSNLKIWLELLTIYVTLQYTTSFAYIAGAILFASTVYGCIFYACSRYVTPTLFFQKSMLDLTQIRYLAKKGVSFQGLAVGNALMLQGSLLAVQATLGSASVVIFNTARALVGAVLQGMGTLNTVTNSEFSQLIGEGNLKKASRLHRITAMLTIVMGFTGTFVLAIWGTELYSLWTGGKLEMPRKLLLLFLLPIPIVAIYASSAGIHTASNRHEGLALRHVVGSALSVFACYYLSKSFGLYGAAAAMVILNIVSAKYILMEALNILEDNIHDFMFGILHEARNIFFIVREAVFRHKT